MFRHLSERAIIAIGFVLAVFPLLGFWLSGLTDLDEGYYGAVIAEMNRRGEWITPYYNGSPWFEKPILLYWISKPWVALFGTTWGPRMGVVLCAALLYWLVFRFVRKHFGATAGVGTMLVLATNLYMVFYGRMLMTDVPLTLCFWLVLSGMYEALLGDKKAWVIAGIGLGLSVLAKGPVGLILVGTLAAWTYWKQPSQRTEILRGGAIVLALTVIIMSVWYVPCYLANRDTFVQKFLIEQNLNRFQGGDAAHLVKPAILGPIYYVILLLVGFAPWWWYLRESWPKFLDRTPRTDHLRLFSRWAVVVIGFFTISAAKLPHYVLPALPALAVLVGVNLFAGSRSGDEHVIDALQPDILKRPALLSLVFFVLANVGLISWDGSSGNRDLHNMVRSVKGQQLAVFQLTRRTADLGTGGTKLMDTSHPSIAFYLDAPYTEAETWEELDRSPAKWVLTRPDRITDGDATLHRLVIHEKSDHYVLFERTDR